MEWFSNLISNSFFLGIYLKDTILNVLKKFKIDINQVYTITSDNGANMLKAIHLFKNEFETQVSKNNDFEVDEPVYELVNDDSDTTSTSDDNNDNNR